MTSAADSLSIAKHVPKEGAESVSAKLASAAAISGGAVLTLADGSAFEVVDGATLTIGENGSVVFGENTALHFGVSESATSSVVIADSGSVALSDTTKLIVDFSGTLSDEADYSVMTWADGASVSDLSALTKGSSISLLVDGVAYADELWDFSTGNNALTIFRVTPVVISESEQIVDLKTDKYIGTFDSALTEFRGTISGAGSVRSGYDLTFAGDASAHTGTTKVESGTLTIAENATLGSGDFEVAGTLAIAGTHELSNTISGTGSLITTGTVTLTGTNTFSGGVTISAGKLIANNAFALGSANGVVRIAGGQLEINSGIAIAQTNIEIALSDMYSVTAAILGDGSLANGTTITLSSAEEVMLTELVERTKEYQIFASGTSIASNFSAEDFTLGNGLDGWNISSYDANTGKITLESIPEPSTFGLLAGVGALALVAARRRRRAK